MRPNTRHPPDWLLPRRHWRRRRPCRGDYMAAVLLAMLLVEALVDLWRYLL